MDIDKDGNIYVFQRADPGVLKFESGRNSSEELGYGVISAGPLPAHRSFR